MHKKLIWLALLAIFTYIPAIALGNEEDQTSGCENQEPAAMARADVQPETSAFRSGWDTGYKNGYQDGQADHNNGSKFDADDAPNYKGYRSSYDSSMGKRSHFKKGYREGFDLGYQDGYSGLVSRLIEPQAREQIPSASYREETPPEAAPSQTQPSTAEQQPPAQEPSSDQTAQAQPQKLPKTASGLPWLALLGFSGISISLVLRKLRSYTT
jgi:LPXTG-motif cell wall-anchored protein